MKILRGLPRQATMPGHFVVIVPCPYSTTCLKYIPNGFNLHGMPPVALALANPATYNKQRSKMKMKILDHQTLVNLNESSVRAGRKQNLQTGQIPPDPQAEYMVNFNFDHVCTSGRDIRLSVVLKPGRQSTWLDVSQEEFDAIPEFEVSELDWEAAICVGTPRWTE